MVPMFELMEQQQAADMERLRKGLPLERSPELRALAQQVADNHKNRVIEDVDEWARGIAAVWAQHCD